MVVLLINSWVNKPYAEGDIFLGVMVPKIRQLLKNSPVLEMDTLESLLQSKFHEARFFALIALRQQYNRGDELQKQQLFKCYRGCIDRVNNWDLVDVSAPYISGHHFYTHARTELYKLAKSRSLWRRRISIMSTFYFIRQKDFADTLYLAEQLIDDREDLMHKAVGWMLREIGNRNKAAECGFLDKWSAQMPRTMLRYAIEKFPNQERQHYMSSN
ncbi:MAG: 3-methyladenine DNA glycosylase AlkD [Parasphingorhabdus sp.]|jgi:3-methyladenine DNA glycosylase AlkD